MYTRSDARYIRHYDSNILPGQSVRDCYPQPRDSARDTSLDFMQIRSLLCK